MIIEMFLNVIWLVLRGVIALMPTLPVVPLPLLDGVFKALSMTDLVVNVKVLASCLGILFLFSSIELIWGIIMWVVRKIPSVN